MPDVLQLDSDRSSTMHLFVRHDTTLRARATWARSIDRLLDEVQQPQPLLRSMRRLYRRDVAAACAGSLTEIRWVLADDTATVRPEAMRRLREFLTDGVRSPLYRADVEQARRTAHELAVAFVVPAHDHRVKPAAYRDDVAIPVR
jgi:hypothetical protein